MNYFLKYRFAIWTIVILSIIILSSVGTILFFRLTNRPERPTGQNFKKRDQIGQFFRKELNLTSGQEKTLRVYRQQFFENSKNIFDSLEKKRITMIQELSKPKPDTQLLYRIANEMGTLHGNLRHEMIRNLLQIRSICTPEQIKKLNTINDDLIRPERPEHRMKRNEGPRMDSMRKVPPKFQ
jgi:Spy/CpxP family protein refolding chaperone